MTLSIKILNYILWMLWKNRFGKVESKPSVNFVSGKVVFQNPKCIYLGRNVGINNFSYFLPCTHYAGVKYAPKIIIGNNCRIGIRNSFAAIDKIEVGDNVLFAGYVHITDHSHGYENINDSIINQKLISKGPVIIDDGCWLGFNCEILSGVHIGKHSVVAARSVVTKDIPPYSVVAGNPARVVKQYNFQTKKWEKTIN